MNTNTEWNGIYQIGLIKIIVPLMWAYKEIKMDKNKLKRKIKSFATNCALATAMLTLALNYAMFVWSGEGMVWLLIFDIACFVGNTFFAICDWKEIKKMLFF